MDKPRTSDLLGAPLSLDRLPNTERFSTGIGGSCPNHFSKLVPEVQRRFEAALTTLVLTMQMSELIQHFGSRLRKDKTGDGVFGVVGEVVAASIYLDLAKTASLRFVREGKKKDVDFATQDSEVETHNEVKFYRDGFCSPPRAIKAVEAKIDWPASVRSLSANRELFEKARTENENRPIKERNNLRQSRAAELFCKIEEDALPKFRRDKVNLLWLCSRNTIMPSAVAEELSQVVGCLAKGGAETAKNLSAVVWYTLSEQDPVVHFWANPYAEVSFAGSLARALASLAQAAIDRAEKERFRKLEDSQRERMLRHEALRSGAGAKFM